MKQATHNGTCQICGSLQALPGGVLSKHGYTVEHGWFEGVCPGAKHAPLELDRAFADEVASSLLRQAKNEDADAKLVLSGGLLPTRAWNGEHKAVYDPRQRRDTVVKVTVPYAEAPEVYQREAVESLYNSHVDTARRARATSKGISENADRVHGKRELQPRTEEAKTPIVAGTRVRLFGKDGYDVTVVRIEERLCKGCGPYLNGQHLPHAVYVRDGSSTEYGYPVRLIRQAAIIK